MIHYHAFGLDLRANRAIPGLRALPARASSDLPCIDVTLGTLPGGSFAHVPLVFETMGLALHQDADRTHFLYADGTRAVVRSDGGAVWIAWPDDLTVEDAATYLLGPVLAFVLSLRGGLALHAGVFAAGAGAIAIAGGPGAGKSTLVAALALAGVRVLGDDVASLLDVGGRIAVAPSHPLVRLWDDSVSLLGVDGGLPLLTPNWEKRYLDLHERGVFENRPHPLAGILVLSDRPRGAQARVERLSPREAFVEVLSHLHSVWMLPRSPQRGIFTAAERIVASVPVLRLVPALDLARAPELCDLLELGGPVVAHAGGVEARVPAV